jgi:hypothetical protein
MELLTGRVGLVPFDESTVVEGTVCPTTSSSPDAEVRSTLVARLKKKNSSQNHQIEDKKYSIAKQLATYLSLPVWGELRRFLTTNRVPFVCPAWVSVLGVGLSSLSLLSLAASSSA